MSTNNNNSAALSDDGKFSTRALKGYGPTSDLEENIDVGIHQRQEGLSTHVEMSDHGSRRHDRARGVEEIGEVLEDDEGSKNTGPAGTIGEPFDSKSENIESKAVHRMRHGAN